MSEDSRSERESELDEESSNDQNNVENIFIFKRCKCKQYIGISGKEEKGGEGGGGGGIWRKKYTGLGEGVPQKRTEA